MNKKSMKPSKVKALITKIGVGVVALGLVASTVIFAVKYDTSLDYNAQLSEDLTKVNADFDALSLAASLTTSELTNKYNDAVAAHGLAVEAFSADSLEKEAVIADYKEIVAELQKEVAATPIEPVIEEFLGFEEDELALNYSGTLTLDDNDFEKLGDYEIDFDGEDIDVVETLAFSGAFASNEKDFDGETMYMLKDGDIEYKVGFSENMSALDYDEDSAEFSFLGEQFKVVDWSSDSIVLESDAEYSLMAGEEAEGVKVLRIGETSVLVSYGGETENIANGDDYDFGAIEVAIESLFYIEGASDNLAIVSIASDLEETIEDGDEYDANDDYEWFVTEDSLGIKLSEDYDEDDSALKEGDLFILPNDFASLSFELSVEEMNSIDVEYESSTEINFNGDFEDAEGDVYFNGTMFIDEDDDAFATVELKDSDYVLSYNGTDFLIGDISFPLDVSSLSVNGIDETSSDVDVKSIDGIAIEAPEDSLEDGELSFAVPEESIEATLIVE